MTFAQDPLELALDVLLAGGALLLFFAPLLLLVAVLIKLESPGPVLVQQLRDGLNGGQPFTICKSRSMQCREDGAKLFQALRGEMSVVGPRPHTLAHDQQYGAMIAKYHLRFRARPGLTNLAEIKGLRGGTSAVEAMTARGDAATKLWNAGCWTLDAGRWVAMSGSG